MTLSCGTFIRSKLEHIQRSSSEAVAGVGLQTTSSLPNFVMGLSISAQLFKFDFNVTMSLVPSVQILQTLETQLALDFGLRTKPPSKPPINRQRLNKGPFGTASPTAPSAALDEALPNVPVQTGSEEEAPQEPELFLHREPEPREGSRRAGHRVAGVSLPHVFHRTAQLNSSNPTRLPTQWGCTRTTTTTCARSAPPSSAAATPSPPPPATHPDPDRAHLAVIRAAASAPHLVLAACACLRRAGLPPPGRRALPALLRCAARCEGAGAFVGGAHAAAVRVGAQDDGFVGTALVGAYAACGRLGDARRAFDEIAVRDIVAWGVMLDSYCQTRNYKDALLLFAEMKKSGVVPDQLILATVLSACRHIKQLRSGKTIHSYMVVSDTLSMPTSVVLS
ncbi:hypothetical protein U9M48_002080 [Paspalum notatum var. saurae]|uniref:Pentatricopeptide repeat-containing protein n=1 Tax=Paspalum notatum var. saurae TaxID=547442 RepID=A0AAQ3PQM9_PASNO